MPTRETLETFIAAVESNEHVRAIESYYTADASMQENQASPRVGRERLMAHESKVLARAKSVKSLCVRPALLDGDRVAIRWIFEFEWQDGKRTRMEELALQRWEGDKIAEETFFYDPAQLAPK